MKRILAGPHAVEEALRASPGAIEILYLAPSKRPQQFDEIQQLAHRAKIPIEQPPREAISKIAGELNHQGIVAITGAYPYSNLDTLLAQAATTTNPLIVALDQVQDPRNLGAVIRSAHAFGANGIIFPKDRSARVTAAVVRTSAGATELMKTVRVTNLAQTLTRLKKEGYQVFGTAAQGTTPLSEAPWLGPTVLVLGGEGKGLRRLTVNHCDLLLSIPLISSFDSLNVSAAAAIALYEASKQRCLGTDGG